MTVVKKEVAEAFKAFGHRTGASIEVDPNSRRIVKIDGAEVPEELHTEEMQAYADHAIAEAEALAALAEKPAEIDRHQI